MNYTSEEKIFMVEKSSILGSPTLVQRVWRTKYKSRKAPSWSTISRIFNQFKKSGSVVKMNQKTRNNSQKRENAKILIEKVITENHQCR